MNKALRTHSFNASETRSRSGAGLGGPATGAELMALMEEFVERDDIEPLWKRDVVLGTSRVRGETMDTQVWMLKLNHSECTGDSG